MLVLPEPSRWQPPPGSDAVTQPGGEREGSRFVGLSVGLSGTLIAWGCHGGFAKPLGWEPTLAMGAGDCGLLGAPRCRQVLPLSAATSPCLQKWHSPSRTVSLDILPHR